MKIAQEYKGYYLDVFYKDGVCKWRHQADAGNDFKGLTVEEVVAGEF